MKKFWLWILCMLPIYGIGVTKIGLIGDQFCIHAIVPPPLNLVYQLDKTLNNKGYPTRLIHYSGFEATSKEGVAFLEKMLAEDKPDILIILLGYNDAYQKVPLENIKKSFAHMIERATDQHIPVIIGQVDVSCLLQSDEQPHTNQFASLYEELASEYPNVLFFPYLGNHIFTNPYYHYPDNLFPNEAAHVLIGEQLFNKVKSLLDAEPVSVSPFIQVGLIGDSISVPFPVPTFEAFPYLVEKELNAEGYPIRLINYSIGSSNMDSACHRLRDMMEQDKPDIVIITLGMNDVRLILPLECIQTHLLKTVKFALAHQIKIIVGILDPAGLPSNPQPPFHYLLLFKSMYAEVAKRYPQAAFFYFLAPDILLDFEYQIGDFVHPNPLGHQKIKNALKPILKAIIEREQSGESCKGLMKKSKFNLVTTF